jgi:hypothetical protein
MWQWIAHSRDTMHKEMTIILWVTQLGSENLSQVWLVILKNCVQNHSSLVSWCFSLYRCELAIHVCDANSIITALALLCTSHTAGFVRRLDNRRLLNIVFAYDCVLTTVKKKTKRNCHCSPINDLVGPMFSQRVAGFITWLRADWTHLSLPGRQIASLTFRAWCRLQVSGSI